MKAFLRILSIGLSFASGIFIAKGDVNTGLLVFIISALIFLDLKYDERIK